MYSLKAEAKRVFHAMIPNNELIYVYNPTLKAHIVLKMTQTLTRNKQQRGFIFSTRNFQQFPSVVGMFYQT